MIDDFIYLIRYITLAQARLKAKCLIADDKVKPFFANDLSELKYGLH